MCLAVPSRIISIEPEVHSAIVDVLGARRTINTLLMEDELKIGDFVLVHAGFAIQKLEKEYAEDTIKLFREYMEQFEEPEDASYSEEH